MPSSVSKDPSDDDDWDGDGGEGDEAEGDDAMFQTLDDHPVLVNKGIYIGSFMAEHNKASLKAAGITHILQVREESPESSRLHTWHCVYPVCLTYAEHCDACMSAWKLTVLERHDGKDERLYMHAAIR